MRKLCFGGSFNPIHHGHLICARAVAESRGDHGVVLIPSALPPHKLHAKELADPPHRLNLCRLAAAADPMFEVDDQELRRTGPSYTIDTVRALPAALGLPEDVPMHLILGSDVLDGLAQWREARALLERVQPVVVFRPQGESAASFEGSLAGIERQLGSALARKVRAGCLRLPPVPVSASDLRARLPGLAAEVPGLQSDVLAYIRARGLYGARA